MYAPTCKRSCLIYETKRNGTTLTRKGKNNPNGELFMEI